MDKISVVIPAFNRPELVTRAIISALEQTVPVEVIVVDDGSQPPLYQLLPRLYLQQIFLIRNNERRNAAFSRNRGVEVASSPIIAFLDSDDEWLPDHLSIALSVLHPTEFMLYVTPIKSGDQCGGSISDPYSYLFGGLGDFRTSGLVCCVSVFHQIGGFDDELNKHQDWDFVFRAARQECNLVLGPKVTVVVDIQAEGRMSARPNLEASQKFFLTHRSYMENSAKYAFFSGIVRGCSFVGDWRSLVICKEWARLHIDPAKLDYISKLSWYCPRLVFSTFRLRAFLRRLGNQ